MEEYIRELESIEVRVLDSKPMPWGIVPTEVKRTKKVEEPVKPTVFSVPVSIEPADEEREFIDSKDSFALDTVAVADLTVDQLARSLEVAGLKFEIRAWR
jgi:hypothetical protein